MTGSSFRARVPTEVGARSKRWLGARAPTFRKGEKRSCECRSRMTVSVAASHLNSVSNRNSTACHSIPQNLYPVPTPALGQSRRSGVASRAPTHVGTLLLCGVKGSHQQEGRPLFTTTAHEDAWPLLGQSRRSGVASRVRSRRQPMRTLGRFLARAARLATLGRLVGFQVYLSIGIYIRWKPLFCLAEFTHSAGSRRWRMHHPVCLML